MNEMEFFLNSYLNSLYYYVENKIKNTQLMHEIEFANEKYNNNFLRQLGI